MHFRFTAYVCFLAGVIGAQPRDPAGFASFTAAPTGPYEIRIVPRAESAVSLHSSRHKPPRAARREFERALKFEKHGEADRAIESLLRATTMDPEYMQAWNNPGVQLLRANRTQEAVAALRTAVKLDPAAPLAQSNYAGALGVSGNLVEGEQAARKALALDSSLTRARYLLALALYIQRKNTDEALHHLSAIAMEYPRAHRLAAALLWQAGKYDEARARHSLWTVAGAR